MGNASRGSSHESSATSPSVRKRLVSAEHGVNVESWEVSSAQADTTAGTPWSIRKLTLRGGKQEGVDLVVVDNGVLRITIVPTRGMGIWRVEADGLRLGWDSPVREAVHPRFVNLESRSGHGWLDGFNEWLTRCGLEFAGQAGRDVFVNNMGEEAEMDLTLHGKIANTPASEVEAVVEYDPSCTLVVRGRVDECMFYGPKLELHTEIAAVPGASSFRLREIVRNRGALDQEFQLIYHANYGPPLLEEGSRLFGAVRQVTPFNAHAARAVKDHALYEGPSAGFTEQVYCIRPWAAADGRTAVLLHNAAGDLGSSMEFSVDQLPFFTLWKNTSAVEDGYVTGLEPGTGWTHNRRVERMFGRVPCLAPGESREFSIDFALHRGASEVEAMKSKIRDIQGGRVARIDSKPVRIPQRPPSGARRG